MGDLGNDDPNLARDKVSENKVSQVVKIL